jgi:hypothetical protein
VVGEALADSQRSLAFVTTRVPRGPAAAVVLDDE